MATAKKKNPVTFEKVWLDAQGNPVDKIEEATGGRFTANGETVEYQIPEGNPRLWAANFGLRTIITNEISGAFQAGESTAAAQAQAARDRLAVLFAGEQFADRSREGGGFRVNAEALAAALADMQVKSKKIARDQRDAKANDILARIVEVDGTKVLPHPTKGNQPLRWWLSVPGVQDAYNVHMGKEVASLDDLGAI